MTSADQRPTTAGPRADAADTRADVAGTADSRADMAGTTGAAGTTASERSAPLTSLSSLLGGEFESGTACAADGTCD